MPTSRSAIATRRQCQARRFWAFDYMGAGLERKSASLPLVGGTRQHAAQARILMGANVDQVIVDEQQRYRVELEARGVNGTLPEHLEFLVREQQTLLEGLVRGWCKFRLPLILEEYEPVAVEQEWLVDMGDGFELPLRIDLLERHRGTGLLHIRDFKTMATMRDGWLESRLHDLQTLLYIEAVERHTQEYVGGMEYEALIKGGRKTFKTGPYVDRDLQMSPLCYGYAIEQAGKPVEYQAEYTARKGARKFAVWEEFAEVEDWLTLHLAESSMWRELYAVSGVISPTKGERERALYQIKRGEAAYEKNLRTLNACVAEGEPLIEAVSTFIEPNTDNCHVYGTRHRCEFYDICPFAGGANGVETEPVESGMFQLRIDHHEPEAVEVEEAA